MAKLFLLFTLFFALNFPVFAEPAIIEHHRPGVGNYFPIEREAGDPFPNVFISSLENKFSEIKEDTTIAKVGYIAVRYDDSWHVRQTNVLVKPAEPPPFPGQPPARPGYIAFEWGDPGEFDVLAEALAYPIDPLMERSDIEGATIIKLNADSTAWVFQHAEEEEHYDRELAIQAAIVGAFQRTLDNANLDIIRHRKNASVQNAKILAYGRLIEFRDDWVGYALIAEQRKHIGHHVQDQTYIHECVIDAFNDAVKEWKKNKADAWTPIRYHVDTVARRRITTLFDYPEPWNHPTRQVLRKLKAAKAKEAEAAGDGDGSSSDGE